MTRSVRPLKVTKTSRERKENDSKQQTNSLDSTTNEYAQQSLYTRFFYVSFFFFLCVYFSLFYLSQASFLCFFFLSFILFFPTQSGLYFCIFLYINRLLCAGLRVCCVLIASSTEESWIQHKIFN